MKKLTVSANEFAVTVRKACIGIGVARGVADDIASGAVAAASRGLLILPSLLDALDAFTPRPATWQRAGNNWLAHRATALNDAPSIVDLATTGSAVSINSIDQPVLLLGCALAANDTYSIQIGAAHWRDCSSISVQPNGPCAIRLRLTETGKPLTQPAALTVLQKDWQALEAYARLLLVPADAVTRGDAGAGTNDND